MVDRCAGESNPRHRSGSGWRRQNTEANGANTTADKHSTAKAKAHGANSHFQDNLETGASKKGIYVVEWSDAGRFSRSQSEVTVDNFATEGK